MVFFLRYVLKYRLNVVRANLQASFAYPTSRELDQDVMAYYQYLAKVIREVLARPTKKLLLKKMNLSLQASLEEWLQNGKSVIVAFGHTGNWEWTGSYLGLRFPDRVCALYKKVKSPWLNTLLYNRRKSHVNYLIEIKQIGELLKLIKQKPVLILMISDQNPGSDQGIIWAPFLGRETAFVNGPETLATRYALPVVYMQSLPKREGGYALTGQTLFDGLETVAPGEITRRFAEALENNITSCRSHWLWSHKRWKRLKP